jgi:hypothetical protein
LSTYLTTNYRLSFCLLISLILHIILLSLVFPSLYLRKHKNISYPDIEVTLDIPAPQQTTHESNPPEKIGIKNRTPETINHTPPEQKVQISPNGELPFIGSEASRKKTRQVIKQILEEERYIDIMKNRKPTQQASPSPGLFENPDTPDSMEISTYQIMDNQYGFIFRFPDGRVMCARATAPQQSDGFSTGQWLIVVSGCK